MPPNNHSDRDILIPSQRRPQRARVNTVLDIGLTEKILSLVDEFSPLPIGELTSLYKLRYKSYLNVYALGLEDGIIGLFQCLKDSVDLYQSDRDGRWFVKPNEKRRNQIMLLRASTTQPIALMTPENLAKASTFKELLEMKQRARFQVSLATLFNLDNHILWNAEFGSLLVDEKSYIIAPSPYELASMRHGRRFKLECDNITATLRKHPQGILLNHLYTLCRINTALLSVVSIEEATNQYPELFHRVEPEISGMEPLLYDGFSKTIEDLSGPPHKHSPAFKETGPVIAFKAIASGLYQETLLLLKQVGNNGLRLSTWLQTIIDPVNFGNTTNKLSAIKQQWRKEILEITPITLFLILTHFGMVEIKSNKDIKNDLRIHLPPKQIDWQTFMNNLISKSQQHLSKATKPKLWAPL